MEKLILTNFSKEEFSELLETALQKRISNSPSNDCTNEAELLKAKDVARLLKCSVQTVYNYRRRGIIKSYKKAGRSLYFSRQHIDEALKTIVHPKHLTKNS